MRFLGAGAAYGRFWTRGIAGRERGMTSMHADVIQAPLIVKHTSRLRLYAVHIWEAADARAMATMMAVRLQRRRSERREGGGGPALRGSYGSPNSASGGEAALASQTRSTLTEAPVYREDRCASACQWSTGTDGWLRVRANRLQDKRRLSCSANPQPHLGEP